MAAKKKSKPVSPKSARKQGRDLNVLKSLSGQGTKLVEKVVVSKKQSSKTKHKKNIINSNEE
jgi:hypothetical protein